MEQVVIDPAALIFIGALVSVLVTLLKSKITSDPGRLLTVAVFALVGAGVYVWLTDSHYWATFVQILVWAGAIYTYIIRQLEKTQVVQRALGIGPKYQN